MAALFQHAHGTRHVETVNKVNIRLQHSFSMPQAATFYKQVVDSDIRLCSRGKATCKSLLQIVHSRKSVHNAGFCQERARLLFGLALH